MSGKDSLIGVCASCATENNITGKVFLSHKPLQWWELQLPNENTLLDKRWKLKS